MANQVNVSTTTNKVSITPQDTTNVNVNVGTTNTSVNVTQESTSVVQIQTPGVKGNVGPQGPTGSQGPAQDTGSLLTTASYSNPNLTLTKGDGSTFNVGISTTTPTLAEVTAQGSSTTTTITASIISASGAITSSNLSGNNTGDQDLSSLASITQLNASSSTLQTNIDVKVSKASTASFAITGSNVIFANITASGNISASGNLYNNNIILPDTSKIGWDTANAANNINLTGKAGILTIFSGSTFAPTSVPKIQIDASNANLTSSGNIAANVISASRFEGGGINARDSIVKFTAPLTVTSISASGNITANNITSSGNISASGNLSGSSLYVEGTTKNIIASTNGFRISSYTDLKYLESTGNTLQWRTNNDSIFELRSQNGGADDVYIHLEHADAPLTNVSIGTNQSAGSFFIARDEGFDTNKDFTITGSNGYVGINEPNPTEQLSVNGNISSSGNLLGGGLNINGPSNSHVEVGTYNVGFDQLNLPGVAETQITGSGLIISGNMDDQDHHNFLKIGDIELIDVNTLTTQNQFLIHNAKSFKISSGSDGGDITQQNRLMEHDGTTFILYSGNTAKITVSNTDITLNATNGPSFRAPNATSATHFNSFFSDPNNTPSAVRSIAKGDMFAVIGEGHVTASAVSSSGTSSFAQISLPDLPTSDPGIAGRLFTTQSTGAGGNLDGQKILLVSAG